MTAVPWEQMYEAMRTNALEALQRADRAEKEIERLQRQLKAMTQCAKARGELLDSPAVVAALNQ